MELALREDLWSQDKLHVNVETDFKGEQIVRELHKSPVYIQQTEL